LVKYGRAGRANSVLPGTEHPDDGRQNRNKDNDCNDIVDVLGNIRNEMAQGKAPQDGCANPEDAANSIEQQITGVGHFGGAGNGRAERSNNGNKTREDDRPAAVLFVEIVGALEMAAAEKERIFAAVKGSACGAANPVPDLVTGNGAKHDRKQKPLEWNNACGGKDTCGDEKRVARKKKANKKTGFYKDDRANKRSASRAN
jgi:hypothetical protein